MNVFARSCLRRLGGAIAGAWRAAGRPGPRRMGAGYARWFALAAVAGAGWPVAHAHDVFRDMIQHRLVLVVGAQYIDVALELTFFERWSERERRAMDADADGRISRAELDGYLRRIDSNLASQVRARISGQALTLTPLYEPEVDLLGDAGVQPAHHRLRLHFFAPTPADLRANDVITIDDALWPDVEALTTELTEGNDGCALEAESPELKDASTLRLGVTPSFRVRCVQPPRRAAADNATTTRAPSNFFVADHFMP